MGWTINKGNKGAKTATATLVSDEGDEREVTVPALWEICYVCEGDGTTVFGWGGRNGDYAVFTGSDLAEDPDLRDDLVRGRYNKACPECRGAGKILAPDLDALSDADRDALDAEARADADYEAECEAERRYGC